MASHDIDLNDDDVETLLARTEGWAAGLRLATLSMIRHDDAAKFVAGFAGDSRPVADYLVSEILSQQASGVLEFLLATAGPDRLSVDLARRLSGRDDAGIVLDSLERANALVMRLGQGSTWYRYHTLLRSYLHAELDRRDVEAQRRLNVTAADWFVEHDLPRSALEHAAAAADWDRVVQIVDRYGLRLLLSGEAGALYRVLTLLPPTSRLDRWCAVTAALTALEAGDLPAATRQLDRLGRESSGYRDPRLQVLGATALLHEARLRGDQEAPLATLIEAASVVAAVQDPDLELLSVANRGAARLWLGEYAEAEADLSGRIATRPPQLERLRRPRLSVPLVRNGSRAERLRGCGRAGSGTPSPSPRSAAGRPRPGWPVRTWWPRGPHGRCSIGLMPRATRRLRLPSSIPTSSRKSTWPSAVWGRSLTSSGGSTAAERCSGYAGTGSGWTASG